MHRVPRCDIDNRRPRHRITLADARAGACKCSLACSSAGQTHRITQICESPCTLAARTIRVRRDTAAPRAIACAPPCKSPGTSRSARTRDASTSGGCPAAHPTIARGPCPATAPLTAPLGVESPPPAAVPPWEGPPACSPGRDCAAVPPLLPALDDQGPALLPAVTRVGVGADGACMPVLSLTTGRQRL